MESSYEYSQMSNEDSTQPFNVDEQYQYSDSYQAESIDLQTVPECYTEDNNYQSIDVYPTSHSWEQSCGETLGKNHLYHNSSQSDLTTTKMRNIESAQNDATLKYNQDIPFEETNSNADYESIIPTKHLYYDPNPEIIRKSTTTNPVVYNQNIMVRFLQPPPVPLGPLIIREVRPPQPQPSSPLVIRQSAPPPVTPPPLILREKPPPIPDIMTEKVITKTLPPTAPPPRSVIIEKLPPLPSKPRDIIIERWIPYEAVQKRKVIVQRAEEIKPYPRPKNVIITYEPVQSKIIRQFKRLGIVAEDPHKYAAMYGNSLLDTEQLLAQARQLGINEDLSIPQAFINKQQQQQTPLTIDQQNYNNNISLEQQIYSKINDNNKNNIYAPTYENLISGRSSSSSSSKPINYEAFHEQQVIHNGQFYSSSVEDLSTELAQYGMTTDSIPY